MRKIGLSAISIYPWSLGKKGISNCLEVVEYARLDGLELLPLLGLTENELKDIDPSLIISYEGPWSENSKSEKMDKIIGGDCSAIFMPLIFGSKQSVAQKLEWFEDLFPNAIPIDIFDNPNSTMEVRKANLWGDRDNLALDLHHILEVCKSTSECLGLISQLSFQKKIRILHFQTKDYKELLKFIDLKACALLSMFKAFLKFDRNRDVPIIIKLPPSMTLFDSKRILSDLGGVIQELDH